VIKPDPFFKCRSFFSFFFNDVHFSKLMSFKKVKDDLQKKNEKSYPVSQNDVKEYIFFLVIEILSDVSQL
jgi:hypothetical protein